jgi:hypothetical protein
MKRPLYLLKLPAPIIDLDGEIWKPVIVNIIHYKYEISNMGRLKYFSRSAPRLVSTSKKPNMYSCHTLYGYGETPDINISIHRLVGLHFVENPDNLPEVNHKNAIKNDNLHSNLEWVTKKGNSQHALINGLRIFKYGSDNKSAKLAINIETGIFYDTIRDAAKAHNLKHGTLTHRLSGRLVNNTSILVV